MCLIVIWNIYAQKKYTYERDTHSKRKKNIAHKRFYFSIWLDNSKPDDHTSISRILMTDSIQVYNIHDHYSISIICIYWKCVDTIEYSGDKWMDRRKDR